MGRNAAAAIFILLLSGCSDPAPVVTEAGAPQPAPVATAEVRETNDCTAEASEANNYRLLYEAAFADAEALRVENRQATEELDAARRELDRYRAGLNRAVAQLNQATPPPRGDRSPSQVARVITLRGPDIAQFGDRITVTGKLFNSGNATARGRVEVTLDGDGRRIGTQSQYLEIGAGMDAYYETTFSPAISDARFTASARWSG